MWWINITMENVCYNSSNIISIRNLHNIQNKGKESENSYQKLKRSRWTDTWTHTRKQNLNISTDTAIFLNQKRANVCEHMTKMASLHLCHVLTCISSLLIEKDCRVHWNITILFPCVCSCVCPPWSLQFSLSFPLFCFIQTYIIDNLTV
jgi:hypothetical protein